MSDQLRDKPPGYSEQLTRQFPGYTPPTTMGQWAVFVGKPKPAMGNLEPAEFIQSQIGKRVWPPERNTFTTRKAARARAKETSAHNNYWNFVVKKVVGNDNA